MLSELSIRIFIPLLSISMSFYPNISFAKEFPGKGESDFGERSRYFNYQSVFRRFAFPPGTFLIFEPDLILPAWRDNPISRRSNKVEESDTDDLTCASSREGFQDEDVDVSAVKNADIIIASPFYVYFDKLGWTHEDSIYNSHNHVAPYLQSYIVNPVLDIFGVPPPAPAVKKKDEGKTPNLKRRRVPLSERHRLTVFHKIEKLLEEIGVINGKACLLRAICELHEFPFESGRFGMAGEVLAMILGSIPKKEGGERDGDTCLKIYAKAENSGRQKDCLKYARHCPHSIFQWYWRFTNNALIEK